MIEIIKLNKTYDRGRKGDHRVLKDVSFTLPDKGFVCILGPSGCGKTSLLNAIGGLDTFDNGTLATQSVQVHRYGTRAYNAERNRNFGYIFQNYYLLDNHSVAYNVYLGLHSLDLTHREKLRRVRQALQAVDMERFIRRKVSDLSGGQQQRIAIARALARRPRVIFADEPTGNLDDANTRNICALLRKASKDSLVVMVTHEEHIARFFADRIITLDQGVISEDTTQWDRSSLQLESDKTIYTGDFQQQILQENTVQLRLLQSADAAPIHLTVIATRDRVVLKLDDPRAITLSQGNEPPQLVEGNRPVMTLEEMDRQGSDSFPLFSEPPAPQTKSGKGLTLPMMLGESKLLMAGKGLKRAGMRLFLILLAAVMLFTVADYITVSHINPQDFITSDSHILMLHLETGKDLPSTPPPGGGTWERYYQLQYQQYLEDSGLDFYFVPQYTTPPQYSMTLFYQQDMVTMKLPAFSYVPLDYLNPDTLIYGRMPENSEEVVVDIILLRAMLEEEGVVKNGVNDLSFFLGEQLNFGGKGLNPTIVGISDSGERALYLTEAAMYTLGNQGNNVITWSEFQSRYPGMFDDVTLEEGQRIVNTASAGVIWQSRIGTLYGRDPHKFRVLDVVDLPQMSAQYIVADGTVRALIKSTLTNKISLYCPDKEAMLAYVAEQASQGEQEGNLIVLYSDPYAEKYAVYAEAAHLRADGRTIVTATILLLCMVMLYLLCRAQVQGRLGLIAVYRLLGIPKRKLHGIFLMEAVLSALGTIVPTAAVSWLSVYVLARIPEIALDLLLPWQATVIVSIVLLGYYVLGSLLPLAQLLRLPPAQLAAKYDM
ncbi:MAG: ABC transporter ATP-binding protein/permease [Oscillospiraceae bacterium]|nr:ABC transporter ATP-binding protein/permease [Oscillospiraceae bacterium]